MFLLSCCLASGNVSMQQRTRPEPKLNGRECGRSVNHSQSARRPTKRARNARSLHQPKRPSNFQVPLICCARLFIQFLVWRMVNLCFLSRFFYLFCLYCIENVMPRMTMICSESMTYSQFYLSAIETSSNLFFIWVDTEIGPNQIFAFVEPFP